MIVFCSVRNAKELGRGKLYMTVCKLLPHVSHYENLDIFSPQKEYVWGYKYGDVSEREYTAKYIADLEARRPLIEKFLGSLTQDITLMCYCQEGKFCHRRLLFEWIGEQWPMIERILR